MLVNHRYKFLFVHIPKTGGGAFRDYNKKYLSSRWRKNCEEVGASHDPLTPEIAERFKDYTKFTIVRNPWKMIASAYRFETGGISHDKEGVLRQREIPVLDWLEEKVADEARVGPFPSQIRYVSDQGQPLIDRFCRQEELTRDMSALMDDLGAPNHPDFWEKPVRHYYGDYDWKSCFDDPAVKARVEELCKRDFEYFRWDSPFASEI